jgi:hypothetical protein
MGFIVPFAMFGVAVGVIFAWGLRDKRSRLAGKSAVRPRKAA